MGRLKNKKPNVPKVSLEHYFWVIAGVPKSGKTSLFAKLVEKHFGNVESGLLLALEKGYQALNVVAEDINDWDDFVEVIDELIEEKEELPFKLIGIDTADILWDYAQAKVVEEWNRDNPSLYTQDIDGVGMKKPNGKGFGVGYKRAKEKIREQIDKLLKSGYGVMVLTHDKDKHVEEKNGLEYDLLTLSLSNSAREIFVNAADFIVFITLEKEKVDDQIVTNRYINFRSDGFIEAGSRFENLPQRIPYDIDLFIESFENAVKSAMGDKNIDFKKKREEERKELDNMKIDKKPKSLDEIKKEIIDIATEKSKNGKKKEVINAIAENNDGNQNPNAINDIVTAQTVLEAVKKV